MAIFSAYFDASGKPNASYRVMTVAGMISSVAKWIRFEIDWNAALSRQHVKIFHMTDFAASEKEFKAWKGDRKRRSEFIAELVRIIQRHTNKMVVSSVELSGWHSLNGRYALEEVFGSPYALCGISAVGEVLRWAGKKSPKTPVQFIFEDGDEGNGALDKRCRREGVNPIFKPKYAVVPCQAADLIAWKHRIAMTEATRLSEGDEAGMDSILESLNTVKVRPTSGGIFSRESLNRLCKEAPIPKRGALIQSGKPGFKE
jgi:hypothetical protein